MTEDLVRKDLQFISDKRINLNAEGSILTDNYYTRQNSTISRAETTWNLGRFSQTLTNLNFGAQSTVIIPRSSMLRQCYLHLELPSIVAQQTIMRGWGYGLIASISYLFGSSNVSQLVINGQTLFHVIMVQQMTSERRSEVLRLAGEEFITPTTDSIHCDILLPLPWSVASIGKIGVDTTLLDSDITISIQFHRNDRIYGGSGTRPTFLLDATLFTAQGQLKNQEQSLRTALQRTPKLRYGYPFIHHQSFVRNISGNGPGLPNTVDLLGFINADLVAVVFTVTQSDLITGQNDQPPSPFAYQELEDVQLLFNGTLMYNSRHKAYKLFNMQDELGSSFFQNSIIQPSASGPFTSDPVDSYPIAIDFSMLPSYAFTNRFYNVWRIGSSTMQLTFTLPDTRTYLLHASYFYNGIASLNNDTKIFFD